jgi:hypothetical protein
MRGSETTLGWVFPETRPVRPDLLQNSSSVRTHRCTSLSLSLSRLPPLILSQLRGAGGFSLSVSLTLSLSLCLPLSPSLSSLSLALSRTNTDMQQCYEYVGTLGRATCSSTQHLAMRETHLAFSS